MARAKRFDRGRAEARRRYRASLAAAQTTEDDTGEVAPAASGGDESVTTSNAGQGRRATLRAPAKASPAQPQGRLSLAQAFRTSFRQANLAEDLRALPRLLIHKAVWVPIVLSAISTVFFIITGPQNVAAAFAFNTFVLPPALAAIFITGFFVPRASYLMAGIVATAAAILYSIFVVAASQGVVPGVQPVPADRVPAEIAGAFSIGPISGVFFGAAAAWYRRFLYLSSPQRGGNRPGSASRGRGSTSRQASRRR